MCFFCTSLTSFLSSKLNKGSFFQPSTVITTFENCDCKVWISKWIHRRWLCGKVGHLLKFMNQKQSVSTSLKKQSISLHQSWLQPSMNSLFFYLFENIHTETAFRTWRKDVAITQLSSLSVVSEDQHKWHRNTNRLNHLQTFLSCYVSSPASSVQLFQFWFNEWESWAIISITSQSAASENRTLLSVTTSYSRLVSKHH